ncbi:MAG TPA: MSMEG_0565 family glycosyltransferase, partial [Thermodesulfobacteriota bacterium]|nr:MSMEG_0565 family glycosyltransferase [Thermodesulfobacteriota bacterium]
MRPLDVALLTYSTKPRGGVVHTLSLAESLARLGHGVHVYSLSSGGNFFRNVDVPHTLIPCPNKEYAGMDEKIADYIDIYTEYLSTRAGKHDIYHAEDCISANALLNLRQRGLIPHFARTVHHIDDFTSQSLIECQLKSVLEPDYVVTVSGTWERRLSEEYSVRSTVINNGVDTRKFRPLREGVSKDKYKKKFSLGGKRVMLSIGGIEPRKNTITALRAFDRARRYFQENGKTLAWVIGGGETLFDYRAYREEFLNEAARLGLHTGKDIFISGNVLDDSLADLYHAADVFVFPSVREGWGLVVLEALASGIPVIASDIEPMTEYLKDGENSLLVSPSDHEAIASGIIELSGNDELRKRLASGGRETAGEYSWENAALGHVRFYAGILNGMMDGKSRAR